MKKTTFVLLLLIGALTLLNCGKETPKGTFKVLYNANGAFTGSAPVDSNTYTSGSTVTVLSNTGTLTKDVCSHPFANWNTQANGSGTTYAPGATFTIGSADVNLYAIFSAGC